MESQEEKLIRILYFFDPCCAKITSLEHRQIYARKILTELGLRRECPDCGGSDKKISPVKIELNADGNEHEEPDHGNAIDCPSCTEGYLYYDVKQLVEVLKNMLAIFDYKLEEGSHERRICDRAKQALSKEGL